MTSHVDAEILLVIPARSGYSGITIDLGLLYLAAALKRAAIKATILHCPNERMDLDAFRRFLEKNRHLKIIGFKCYSVDHNAVKQMARLVKTVLPGCVTIAGGPQPTSLPEYVLQDMPELDYVYGGEGEIGFPLFVENILKGLTVAKVPGLAFRSAAGGVRKNPNEIYQDLDQLPAIGWEDVNLKDYPDFLTSLPFIPVMATRGCPYACKYCASHATFGRKMRYRSVENVIAELVRLRQIHQIRAFNFSDDELTLKREYFLELCERMIQAGLGLKWECSNGVRLDSLDDLVLDKMYQAGCRYVAVGIESASDQVLRAMKKNISIQTIREKIALIRKHKVIPQGLFMIGFPGETEADIRRTIEFAIELDISKTNFSIFMPLPGSEIFDELIESGELKLRDIAWDKMKPDEIVYRHPTIPPARLSLLQRTAYRRFYLRPRPALRLAREMLCR
jgi:radical SAM superfamily enzyme YgiQ (UPF0313 family)